MSDLIDRQRALDAFDYWVKSPMIGYSNGLLRLHEMLEEIPPVKQEPCDDCISRKDAINACSNGWGYDDETIKHIKSNILELPLVKPQQKMGRWIHLDNCSNEGYYCDKCHKRVVKDGWSETVKRINYCPNCGAKMQGGDAE